MVYMERKDNFESGKARWKKQSTFLTSFIQPETSVDVIGTFHKLSYTYVIWWPGQSAQSQLCLRLVLEISFLFI